MTSLVDALKEGVGILKRQDDDSFDRLSNRYTVGLIMATSLFLATKTYVGDPIDCFTPKEFADNWVKYADNYCWVKNTYYIPMDTNLPGPAGLKSPDHSAAKELPYYQWVPIILAFMLLIFAIPVYFWQFSMWASGYDVQSIVSVSSGADSLNPETRDETNKYIVAQLDRHISYQRKMHSIGNVPLGNKYGRFLFIMYVITKCLYITVPIVLLFILNLMMGEGYSTYGVQALSSLSGNGTNYVQNPMFPRVTVCDFAIRRMGQNIHRYTVQCVLTVNLFNEKVFLLLWWWLVVLASLSILGLLICLVKNLRPNAGKDFVMKYLLLMKVADYSDDHNVSVFANRFLSLDGVFCMRLLAKNTTDVIAGEIITELYKRWKSMHRKGSSADSSAMLSDE